MWATVLFTFTENWSHKLGEGNFWIRDILYGEESINSATEEKKILFEILSLF